MEPVRVDKWLWTARIYKTRSLAAEAVTGGHVEVNGARVKPSRDVRPGDHMEVTKGPVRLEFVVRGTATQRRPASEAALLYEETAESRERRERAVEQRRLARPPTPESGGRPTKRDRRRYEASRRRRG